MPPIRLSSQVAPMFLVSGTRLVIESCKAGVVGSFPSLNARSSKIYDEWLKEIKSKTTSPFAVNLIVHKTNARLQEDLDLTIKHKVPIVITSLSLNRDLIKSIHGYGGENKAFNVIGKVYHDVTNEYHARKAADAGVDGLIAVCSGAGGHAGVTSPFALIPQIRSFYKGTVICSGSISCGFGIRSAIALGADYAYLGTRFITTKESLASDSYKEMIVDAKSGKASEFPIQYTDKVSGIPANFIKKSLIENNVKFEETSGDVPVEDMSDPATAKAWKDIFSAGHGVVNIDDVPSVSDLVARLSKEYEQAKVRESRVYL